MAKSAKGKTKLVQSVDRALSMLEVLASEPKGLTLSQLSKKLGLLPQTAQGLVRTLQAHEMVSQADSGMPYMFGSRICQMAKHWTANQDRSALCGDVVSALSSDIGECVLLAELRGGAVFGLVEARSEQPLTVGYECESFAYPHTMATGKLLMAFLPAERQEAVLEKLHLIKMGPLTITSRDQLCKNLAKIRRQGYVVSIEEGTAGVGTMAVPVRNADGQVIAALGVCIPLVRFAPARRGILRKQLFAAAEQIERLWAMR